MYTKGVLSSQLSDPLIGMLASNISAIQQIPPTEDEKKEAKALNATLLNNIAGIYIIEGTFLWFWFNCSLYVEAQEMG